MPRVLLVDDDETIRDTVKSTQVDVEDLNTTKDTKAKRAKP